MKKLLAAILFFASAVGTAYFVPQPTVQVQVQSADVVGAAIPQSPAVFETSLQSGITNSATSMTLTSATIRGGSTLSGYNCFTIHEGNSDAEFVCGTVSGTSVTSLTRGINPATGTTTVSSLQFAHRRGDSVKITTFPIVQILKAQNNGEDTFPNQLSFEAINKYTSALSFTPGSNQLASVKYAEDYANAVIAGGAATSTELLGGKVELATQLEMASSTAIDVDKPRALWARYSTSSPYTMGYWIPITNARGVLNPLFIATSSIDAPAGYTWSVPHTFSGSLTTYASSTWNGLMNIASSTQASSTISKLQVTGGASFGTASSSIANNSIQVSGLASTSRLTTSNSCDGCISGNGNGYQIITAAGVFDGGTPARVDANLNCPSDKIVISGGWNSTVDVNNGTTWSYPSATTTWAFRLSTNNGTTNAVTFYAICVRP